jgi:sulfate adenylyltransferase
MRVEDKFQPDIKKEALNVFKTTDTAHPGVARLFSRQGTCLGGSVKVLSEGDYRQRFPEYAAPIETRRIFKERGWSTITAFQTRNPLHRSHEYLTKVALETSDGLLIHPIVGKLKPGDIPAEVRMQCYRAVLDRYYPADRVVLKVYPMEMRYAGPREAVLHAIIRQNFGCSHMIVGRDHAGVGDYYGTFDAQNIFDSLAPDDLQIAPIKFEHVFWCRTCGAMASIKTCPHPPEEHLFISGTKLRGMFAKGETPPPQIARPEVVEILIDYYRGLKEN